MTRTPRSGYNPAFAARLFEIRCAIETTAEETRPGPDPESLSAPEPPLQSRPRTANRIGTYRLMSHFRRLVVDLMHFSAKVPSATVERRLKLASLCHARRLCTPTPTWSGIFAKAYARVAARIPQLRTSYLDFPWPCFYEHPVSIATINIDRWLPGERIVLYAHVPSPQDLTLPEIDEIIHFHRNAAVESLPSYRWATWLSRVPWPFRRWLYWAALHVWGPMRCRSFGTFSISSVGCHGAGLLQLLPILTTSLHYNMLDSAGMLEMRLTFDHRVLDGATAAQALAELEGVLLGEMTHECVQLARRRDLAGRAVLSAENGVAG